MSQPQILLSIILLLTVVMFLWGRWRHDFVALGALVLCVFLGVVPEQQAFAGFAHPAVITVAFVLILSGVLQQTGAADRLLQVVMPRNAGRLMSMAVLVITAAVLSGFMNNVGALAILMPVALQIAARHQIPPGQLLMPLAFGSILGGMTTMIGTPPNLIVAGFRAETGVGSFAMFDFAPVGVAVMLAGVAFIILIGWRLVPVRERGDVESFETGAYLAEVRVDEGSKAAGISLHEIEEALDDVQIIGLIHADVRIPAPHPRRKIHAGDILVVEAEPEALAAVLSSMELVLVGEKRSEPEAFESEGKAALAAAGNSDEQSDKLRAVKSEDVGLMEVTLLPRSRLVGRSVTDIHLRTRHRINLLALSREGHRSQTRMRRMRLKVGDVLLLQGAHEDLMDFVAEYDALPLAERALTLPHKREAWMAGGLMAMAVGAASFGLLPAAIAFVAAALLAVWTGLIAPRRFYDAIDWPVIVLLGALIPVAQAVGDTGIAELLAIGLVEHIAQGHTIAALVLILIVTMTLSDFMNNAATAAVMCPIAIGTANTLGVNADALLMAVAIGASCAFLTPIGHQNNTLILGPGGFRFSDYWRLGLPMEILVISVSVPMLLWVWPL
ncbi:MAG: SLC13 family permease [Chromatiales bacterium]|nr:SLC13 family permease [Gammaproteobacteria bacterium]MBW6476571.1 SLC13 family permease [Chromatiales bacterium]